MIEILPDFIPRFLTGVVLNFEIAAGSLLMGLLIGVPIALARLRGRSLGIVASTATGVMRAAPTFVVMFFLLGRLEHGHRLVDLIGHAGEPRREDVEERGYAGEQEDRRQRQLDDVRDGIEGIHESEALTE